MEVKMDNQNKRLPFLIVENYEISEVMIFKIYFHLLYFQFFCNMLKK